MISLEVFLLLRDFFFVPEEDEEICNMFFHLSMPIPERYDFFLFFFVFDFMADKKTSACECLFALPIVTRLFFSFLFGDSNLIFKEFFNVIFVCPDFRFFFVEQVVR